MGKWITIDKKDVNELLGNDYNIVYETIYEDAEKNGIDLLSMDDGLTTTYRWFLEGDGWQSVISITDESVLSDVSREFEKRKKQLYPLFDNQQSTLPKKEDVFTIPSNEYVYYKHDDQSRLRFAIAAWGFKFPDTERGGDFTVYVIPGPKRQDVKIEFLWNGKRLKKFVFYFSYQDDDGINEVKTQTDNLPLCDEDDGEPIIDGIWRCDNPIEVGKEFHLRTEDGKEFSFVVEEGKSMYTFELTKYFDVEITVLQDGTPAANRKCELVGIGDSTQYTDDNGMIKIQFPLEGDKGQPKNPQPELIVYCDGKNQSMIPIEGALLKYQFEFVTPPPPPEYVSVSAYDVGDFLAPNLPVVVFTKKKGKKVMHTDKNGVLHIPKPWLTDGEDIEISSPWCKILKKYSKSHDCHPDNPKKHVENK